MKKLFFVAGTATMLTFASFVSLAQTKAKPSTPNQAKAKATAASPATPVLKSTLDSVSYSIGVLVAQNFKSQQITLDPALVQKGFAAVMNAGGVQLLDLPACQSVVNNYMTKIQQKMAAEEAKKFEPNRLEGEKFLAENKKKAGVVTTASGLQYEIIKAGEGEKPKESDKVKTHYHGTLIDGTVFDSSVSRGEPVTFPVNAVIPGWVEALQLMPVGSKWKLYIPQNLAYGGRAAGDKIKPYSALVFEVELISIEK